MVHPSVLTENVSLQLNFVGEMLPGPSMFFAKISLLLLYLRIFGLKNWVRFTIYFGLLFAFCLYWGNMAILSYYCTPGPGKKWDMQELGGSREEVPKILAPVTGALNLLLDLFIFILPIPVIMGLQMNAQKKVAVLTVFLTGFL